MSSSNKCLIWVYNFCMQSKNSWKGSNLRPLEVKPTLYLWATCLWSNFHPNNVMFPSWCLLRSCSFFFTIENCIANYEVWLLFEFCIQVGSSNSLSRWTKFTASRESEFLQLLSLQKVLSLVNAKSVPLRYFISPPHFQPFNRIVFHKQMFVNTTTPVAQR